MHPPPADFDGLTPAWLTSALRASGALGDDQSVVSVELGPGAGGIAVTSRVSRLLLTLDPPGGGAPSSVFAKIPRPSHLDDFDLEVRFFQELAPRLPNTVPGCFHADYDSDTERGVLLLEDLTELRPGHLDGGCDRTTTEFVLAEVARIHRAFWESPLLAEIDWPSFAVTADRAALFVARLRREWPAFLAQADYPVPPDVADWFESTSDEEFVAARTAMGGPPVTLVHDDLHTQNFLLAEDDDGTQRVTIIDWQDASRGHPALDFATVVVSNADPALSREERLELLRGYHRALGPEIDYAFDRLLDDLRLATAWLMHVQVVFLGYYEAADGLEVDVLRGEWERMIAGWRHFAR